MADLPDGNPGKRQCADTYRASRWYSDHKRRRNINQFGAWMFVSGAGVGVVVGYVLRWVGV